MKDQITYDLSVAAAKVAPPVAVATASVAGAIDPQSVLIWLSILYTLALLMTLGIKNWGDWMTWWAARFVQAGRLWAWVRRRG